MPSTTAFNLLLLPREKKGGEARNKVQMEETAFGGQESVALSCYGLNRLLPLCLFNLYAQ